MPTTPHQDDLHILILDDTTEPPCDKIVTYSKFVRPEDRIKLFIISSLGALTDEDKQNSADYVEMESPERNACLEIEAMRLHQKHRIDLIYTKQEELIIRAATLRKMFNLPRAKGFVSPDDALFFRDKVLMKDIAQKGGFPVPKFRRLRYPLDLVEFAQQCGYPVIVKPAMGCASAGVQVIRSWDDLVSFLSSNFFPTREDSHDWRITYGTDMIVEQFVDAEMYHVNGCLIDGQLQVMWPFKYISTNFGFTQGVAYGNVLIPKSDARWTQLRDAAIRLLQCFPTPRRLMFHLELFGRPTATGGLEFLLCEIAARRPGGSIGHLIDLAEGGGIWGELEFRLSVGLPFRHNRSERSCYENDPSFVVGDLIVPRKKGHRLKYIPDAGSCTIPGITYLPIEKAGSEYLCYDCTTVNTCARMVAVSSGVPSNTDSIERTLDQALRWFQKHVVHEKLGPESPTCSMASTDESSSCERTPCSDLWSA
ncbi:ATP-grasp domain-containing protein [Polychytrium aggregatum]|uniref:ATP-grasp domain-containing protein n=1 Tax=Polychytrium aggregatum TaxID=110093 RepID=UPI0022FEA60B|nr:ATP-grasp domain-containing protein [Polychytrium aggregatum]KAI9204805.1 ATP-grasp domain-containing protein [Polychytrium aggregatum]